MKPKTMEVSFLSSMRGALIKNDKYTHYSCFLVNKTACGKRTGEFLDSFEFTVDCPVCLKEIQYRENNLSAREDEFGICHV